MARTPERKAAKAAKAPAPAPAQDSRRLQMADVARLAGVSVSTVSRSLNGSALISARTRKRVRDLAQSLNYSIDVGAQNLRLRQNRTVAVLLPFDRRTREPIADPFAESMLSTLADELNDHGYHMLLARVDTERIDAVTQFHGAGRAIGVLMIGQWQQHEQLNELAARGFPIVVWGARLPQQLYCTVGSDNVAGGLAVTRHLISCGCKGIAFFGDTGVPEVAQRYDGHCQALIESGHPIDPALYVTAGFRADDARQATLGLLRRGVTFDAIFACNDSLAIATIGTLRELNVRVPEDIAVVGYDDIELASYCHPPLTTVRQPIRAAGRALVDALVALMAGKGPSPMLLPTELIVRQSSVRPARRAARRATTGR
jgi:DNA-binding LacI/PurR family transcriptional regulator